MVEVSVRMVDEHQASVKNLLHVLSGPSLSSFALCGWGGGPSSSSSLCKEIYQHDVEAVLSKSCNIKHIVVQVYLSPRTLHQLMENTGLSSISFIRLPNANAFHRLGSLSGLQRLSMPLEKHEYLATPRPRLFPALRHVEFIQCHLRQLREALPSIKSTVLTVFSATLRADVEPLKADALFVVVSSLPPCSPIARLNISIHFADNRRYFDTLEHLPLDFTPTAEALAGFRSLNVLRIHIKSRVLSVTDNALLRLASSHPSLSVLSLTYQIFSIQGERPTICGLVELARQCTRLTLLECDVEAASEIEVRAVEELAEGDAAARDQVQARPEWYWRGLWSGFPSCGMQQVCSFAKRRCSDLWAR